MKFGSDLVVTKNGINTDFMQSTALQALTLVEDQKDLLLLLITSGSVKLGRILGTQTGQELTKVEAAHKGFNPLMTAWQQCFEQVGLSATILPVTGQSLTKKNSQNLRRKIKTSQSNVVIINNHDGLNSEKFKYAREASNNDLLGEIFADWFSTLYVIGTNVDGVLDNHGLLVSHFNSLDQLNDITFHQASNSGTGGMETKLWAAIRHAQKPGRTAYIVNGQTENMLLKVLKGEPVGTKVAFIK